MKYAIVTGGTSGIGFGVADMLIKKGYHVFAIYVGNKFTDEIENFEPIKVDQTSGKELYQFIAYVKE